MTKGHNTKCVYKGVVQNYGPVSLAASLSFWRHLNLFATGHYIYMHTITDDFQPRAFGCYGRTADVTASRGI